MTFPLRNLVALLGAVLTLLVAAPAQARPASLQPPVPVEVGDAALGATATGKPSILIPVRYPIEAAGRRAKLRVQLLGDDGRTLRRLTLREPLSAGRIRKPERRDRFTYVHRVDLGPRLAKRASGRLRVRIDARAIGRSTWRATRPATVFAAACRGFGFSRGGRS